MTDDIDQMLRQLADEPVPARLDQLETDVMGRIVSSGVNTAVAPLWRVAAVGIALVVGLGVGGSSAVALNSAPAGFADSIAGANLAPSSLLATS